MTILDTGDHRETGQTFFPDFEMEGLGDMWFFRTGKKEDGDKCFEGNSGWESSAEGGAAGEFAAETETRGDVGQKQSLGLEEIRVGLEREALFYFIVNVQACPHVLTIATSHVSQMRVWGCFSRALISEAITQLISPASRLPAHLT